MDNLELIKELENARFLMNKSKKLKIEAVQNQKWETAAYYRDDERKYEKIIKELEEKIRPS
jgi:hypothetical protein